MIRELAIDVDNVLADSIASWCVRASEFLGRTVDKNQIANHKIVGSVPISPRAIFRLQDEVWENWKHLPATEPDLASRISSIKRLSIRIVVATSGPTRRLALVRKWLDKNKIVYDALRSLGPYGKKELLKADALVDDAPEIIEAFVRTRRIGFLYLQPWNKKQSIRDAVKVRSMSEVVAFLKRSNALSGQLSVGDKTAE